MKDVITRYFVVGAMILIFMLLFVAAVNAEEIPIDLDFDDSGTMIDTDAEATFNMPDLKTGVMVDCVNGSVKPHLSIEALQYKKIVFDLGFAEETIFGSVGYNIVPIYEITIFGFVGYQFKEEDPSAGVGISVIKF
jgi:hypothetical protein